MSLSEQDKEKARKQVEKDFNTAKDSVEKQTISTYQSRIKGEIDELFFYVKKRVIQRYIDEFSVFFNPSVLSGQQSESLDSRDRETFMKLSKLYSEINR